MPSECESIPCRLTRGFRKDKCKPIRFLDEEDLRMSVKNAKHEVEERRKKNANR